MNASKQGRHALLIVVVSFMLVIGSLITAFAETSLPSGENQDSITTKAATDIVFITLTNTASPTLFPTKTHTRPAPTATKESTPTSPADPATLSKCDPPVDWEVFIIEYDQTLEDIAAEFQTTTENLIQGNCLSSTELLPEYIIYVPPSSPLPTSTTGSTGCTYPAGWITYTVRSGDNLYKISKAFGITVSELQAANCMGTSTKIITGRTLWVPNVATITPTPTKTPTKTPVPPKPPAPTNSAPVAENDAYTAEPDGSLTVNDLLGVLANDTDADLDPLTAILASGPECATSTLNLQPDGSFTYSGSFTDCGGTDTFTYVANDGSVDSSPAKVTINLPPP